MQHSSVVILVLACLVIAGGAVYLATKAGDSAPAPQGENTPGPLMIVQRELTLPVTVTGQFFNPSEFTVNAGDTLTLQLQSADEPHVVSVPEFAIEQTVEVGTITTVTIKTAKPGTVQVLCIDRCDAGVALTVTVK